jgi:hypothetical protein
MQGLNSNAWFRRLFLLAALPLLAGCAPKPATALTGRDEAERDVAGGTLKLFLYGESTQAHRDFADLFGKIGGTVEELGKRKLAEDEDQKIQDYNRYVLQELSRRGGAKAVPKLLEKSGLNMDRILHKRE